MSSIVTAASLLEGWVADLTTGKGPVLHDCGHAFAELETGPGLVTLIGGAPGAGKTALTVQAIIDAMRADSSLRVLVANVEMSPNVLLDRQLARLAGVPLDDVRFRRLGPWADRVASGVAALTAIADRLAFHAGPFTLRSVADSLKEHRAGLAVLDYVQRFRLGDDADRDQRNELDGMMTVLRRWADAGLAVLAVSAVARQKGKGGSHYGGLGLASYRGSSELEFGCDSAWILSNAEDSSLLTFACHKNRNGETPSLSLSFDRARQRFERVTVPVSCRPLPNVPGYDARELDDDDGEAF